MWKWIAIFLAVVLVTTEGKAQSTPLHALMTGDQARGWRAVGRVNLGGSAFCTGSLIAEDLVLTAGHCLFDAETGRQFQASEVEFLADWRSGRASAYRGVRKVVVHPRFQSAGPASTARASHDLALLRLDRPIRNGSIVPFATGSWPRKGAEVGVVSYAHDRAESPSLQDACRVLARRAGALILSCEADFGSSGAPVFVLEDGEVKVVSVISAKAEASGKPVSIGTGLQTPLEEMMALLGPQSEPLLVTGEPRIRRPAGGGGSAGGGAKFLRP